MKNYLDGGEAIIEAFRNLGIDYVITSPGSEWSPVWEALTRQQVEGNDGPGYLSCWHETLAVNVAWGYTTATGRMQAVLLHAGAGPMQGSMGINGANVAETPMLVLSGEVLSYGEQDGFDPGRQWFNSLSIVGSPARLVEPVVKWAERATSPHTLYQQVVRTAELSKRAPTGPTYLCVPLEHMLHEWTKPGDLGPVPPLAKPQAPASEIDAVAKLLANAKYPVLTTESAGRSPEGFAALKQLAEAAALPVVEGTVAEFSNFPKDHPLHQGFDFKPHHGAADLVLMVRSRTPWYPPHDSPPNATVVMIDESPHKGQMVYQNLKADRYLEGDVVATLKALTKAYRRQKPSKTKIEARRKRWASAHDKLQKTARAAEAKLPKSGPIHPIELCMALGAALPKNTVYVDETILHRGFIQRHLPWNGPHSYIHAPTGLGQGLGSTLGFKLAYRDRTVVSLIGDGGFLYNPVVQSLGLARDADLPVLIVIFNNGGYEAMKQNQLDYYPDGAGKRNDIYLGQTINGVDYAALAAPFGGFGRKVEDRAELADAIKEAHAAVKKGRTAILNVMLSH